MYTVQIFSQKSLLSKTFSIPKYSVCVCVCVDEFFDSTGNQTEGLGITSVMLYWSQTGKLMLLSNPES